MLKQFYEDVLPRHGNLCLFTLPDATHYWGLSIDELVLKTERLSSSGQDVYFAVAGFKIRDRHACNADLLRALRVDLDAGPEKIAKHGPEKVYVDQRAAVTGLLQFITDTGLMPTYIVSSGAGLHVYWALDEDIEPREWLPLAEALQVLGDLKGLKIDHACTCDASRILRPLGTIHLKSGNPVRVLKTTPKKWAKAELRAKLSAHVEVMPPGQRRYHNGADFFGALGDAPAGGDTSINADALPIYEPSDANLVADGCAVMGHIRETGGQVAEPLWHAMMGVLKYTVQGDEAAHKWSEGDARYDAYDTQKKYDAWQAAPTTCKHMALHSDLCKTCPHWGKIATPVELGRAKAVSPLPTLPQPPQASLPLPTPPPSRPWEGFLPEGYEVRLNGKSNAMYRMVPLLDEAEQPKKTEDGRPIMVAKLFSNEVFWLINWGSASGEEGAVIEVKMIPHTGNELQAHTLPQTCMASTGKAMDAVTHIGVHSKEPKHMLNFLQDSTQHIKAISQRLRISDRLGLRYLDSGELVAVHGHNVIYKDGRIEKAMIGTDLDPVASLFCMPIAPSSSGTWTPDVWAGVEVLARKHVDFLRVYFNGSPKMQIGLQTVLASPLMAFVTGEYLSGATLPRGGFTLSLYSRKSGRGKTHAARAGLLAYGPPDAIMMSGDASSATDNARVTRLSLHGTMPMMVDEMGQSEPKKAANFISTMANGSARERGTKTGGVKVNTPWAASAVVTTNVSARQMVVADQEASDAIQNRLLEIDVDDVPDHTSEERLQYQKDLPAVASECAGALGALLHKTIVSMGGININRLVADCVLKADKLLGESQAGRFAHRQLGAILAFNVMLKEMGLGVLFPLKPIVEQFKRAFDSGQDFIATNRVSDNPVEQFAAYLSDSQRVTLVTNVFGAPRGTVGVQNFNGRPPDETAVRYCKDERMIYVSKDHLAAWCAHRKLHVNDLICQLGNAGVLKEVIGGVGTNRWLNLRKLTHGTPSDTGGRVRSFAVFYDKMVQSLGEEVDIQPAPPPRNVVALSITR